jgi:hypothetical protein
MYNASHTKQDFQLPGCDSTIGSVTPDPGATLLRGPPNPLSRARGLGSVCTLFLSAMVLLDHMSGAMGHGHVDLLGRFYSAGSL